VTCHSTGRIDHLNRAVLASNPSPIAPSPDLIDALRLKHGTSTAAAGLLYHGVAVLASSYPSFHASSCGCLAFLTAHHNNIAL